MPLIETSSFNPPWYVRQGDIQTIAPRLFRKPSPPSFVRQRIETPDGDFLNLDWVRNGNERLAVLSHGLEGSSISPYIIGMTESLKRRGFDVLAWNFRGCSGEASRNRRGYHSGKWDDLEQVVQTAAASGAYREIFLGGFSVGANITLLYLGNAASHLPSTVTCAVVFCAPVDLAACATAMGSLRNTLYMKWFLRLLKEKLVQQKIFEAGGSEYRDFENLKNFFDFDSKYTAPLFGFESAPSYWKAASSLSVLPEIKIPTLIVNPANDPMLAKQCYPIDECKMNPNLFLEIPRSGGHVGFFETRLRGETWSERRAADFFERYSHRSRVSLKINPELGEDV